MCTLNIDQAIGQVWKYLAVVTAWSNK